jgi:hypothetical protein
MDLCRTKPNAGRHRTATRIIDNGFLIVVTDPMFAPEHKDQTSARAFSQRRRAKKSSTTCVDESAERAAEMPRPVSFRCHRIIILLEVLRTGSQ